MYELNAIVRELVEDNLCETYWVKAEVSEMRVSQKGHCFMELIEKDAADEHIAAKARAVALRNVWPLLRMNFEDSTGQTFRAGLEVLLQVTLSFSEVYGYSLMVQDIDPSFTMGSVARRRKEILDRLEREGVAMMNRELELPVPLQRIAIVSSPTAAGYEDFCRQLEQNRGGFRFEYKLFPAMMQGEQTERTVIAALDAVAAEMDDWDAVAIIRGGGAVSDLSCFDTYPLANCCAQFPLPVLTGIGHERDVSVLDLVACRSLKTPTAVAAFLVERIEEAAENLRQIEESLTEMVDEILQDEKYRLAESVRRLETFRKTFLAERIAQLQGWYDRMAQGAGHRAEMAFLHLNGMDRLMAEKVQSRVRAERGRLQLAEACLKAHDPEHILRLGYSITRKAGSALKDTHGLKSGDELITLLAGGEIISIVK